MDGLYILLQVILVFFHLLKRTEIKVNLNKYDEAEKLYKESMSIFDELKQFAELASVALNLCSLKLSMKK